MTQPPLLSLGQLDRLETLWREQAARIAEQLRPGLSEEDIETQLRPLGLRLPTEAMLWWSWHDGSVKSETEVIGGSHLPFLTLAGAVRRYHASRRVAEAAARIEGEADRLWNPTWFPVTESASGGVIACDCGVPAGEPTPIRYVHWGHNEESDVPNAESFGQMVAWWIDAIERGAWRYDTSLGRWEVDHQLLADPRRELTRLV